MNERIPLEDKTMLTLRSKRLATVHSTKITRKIKDRLLTQEVELTEAIVEDGQAGGRGRHETAEALRYRYRSSG